MIKSYREKIESKLPKICEDIFPVLDKHLFPMPLQARAQTAKRGPINPKQHGRRERPHDGAAAAAKKSLAM